MSDLCVITARDARQARLFELQLAVLEREGALPAGLPRLVVPDPPGPALGTAGATLYALCAAVDHLGGPAALRGRRVFVVHCGGLSQRLPQFAQLGKVFTPLPHAGWAPNPLLAEVLRSLQVIASPVGEGVFVACGDVLYTCAGPAGLAGVPAAVFVAPASPEQAARHGVYDWDAATGLARRVFQKPTPTEQTAAGLVRDGETWLDTGIAYLSPPVAQSWLGLLPPGGSYRERLVRDRSRWVGLEFYEDVTGAMIPGGRESPLGRALGRFPLHVLAPADGRFLHFGTTAELLHLLCTRRPAGDALAWIHPDARREATAWVQAAILGSPESRLGALSLVHYSDMAAPLELAGRNHVLGLRGATPVSLPEGTLLYQAPVRGGRATEALVLLGVEDNPKQDAAGGISFLGTELRDWAARRGLSAADLWGDLPPARQTLWNARLFPQGGPAEVLGCLPEFLDPGRRPRRLPPTLPRVSMAEVQRRFDVSRWRRFEERLHARLLALGLTGAIEHGQAARELLTHAAHTPAGARVAGHLRGLALRERRPLHAARLWQACSLLTAPPEGGSPVVEDTGRAGQAQARAFEAIRRAVGEASPTRAAPVWTARPGSWAEARAPVRVDLAGGWTDTPPQALELGGSVINVALLLRGQRPVRARVEVTERQVLALAALDLDREAEVRTGVELRRCSDPADPFALHRAALIEAGLIPAHTRDLPAFLRRSGGGLRLETESAVPKGSGLGTSSILGATVLAALGAVTGTPPSLGELCNQVLRLEQRLTTGGGWQDQVGALHGGFKLATTGPGPNQTPAIRRLAVPEAVIRAFEERMVVYYTGVPRLARNVLQRVVARYLLREPAIVDALAEMRDLVARLETALLAGDLAAIGAVLTRSWELNRTLEPTASNPDLARLFAAIEPHVLGAKLAGAGGGGFLLALARDPADVPVIRAALAAAGADPEGWFAAQVSPDGLQVAAGGG